MNGDQANSRPAIFLDRDGVIIENRDEYVLAWEDVTFIPSALPALAKLAASDYAVVVVTNQAAVGRGLLSRADAHMINNRIQAEVVHSGGRLDRVYMCPHHPDEDCECRKPKPGLLLQAARELNIDLTQSWMIGDALTDLQAGQAAGVSNSLLVLTGRGAAQKAAHQLDGGYPDLQAAVEYIMQVCQVG
jgi:D-glycero-D-manno-heptose 1,7-bisphosphate phosphatase